MENDIAIRVKNLTKIFKIYNTPGAFLKEIITGRSYHKESIALYDLSFEVKKGEVVGFIGRNGAGKSTLLKILTGTLDKTSGELEINGKISSILELGTGFHPDYSGRENIFMGGLCLGMSREEVKAKEQSIIDFSELEEYIDQPFRTYSSGMKARLTFATAISVDPDILIVDEALSVGDAKFSRKCYDRITRLKESGKTILIVSHDQNSITTFCDKAIFLERGKVIESGDPSYVTKVYFDNLFGKKKYDLPPELAQIGKDSILTLAKEKYINHGSKQTEAKILNDKEIHCGDKSAAEILDFGIVNEYGNKVNLLATHNKYKFFMKVIFYKHVKLPSIGFVIRNVKGIDLFGVNTKGEHLHVDSAQPGDVINVELELCMHITNGTYFFSFGIAEDENMLDFRYDALMFTMVKSPSICDVSMVDLNHTMKYLHVGNIFNETSNVHNCKVKENDIK